GVPLAPALPRLAGRAVRAVLPLALPAWRPRRHHLELQRAAELQAPPAGLDAQPARRERALRARPDPPAAAADRGSEGALPARGRDRRRGDRRALPAR